MSPSISYALVRVTSQRACSGRDVDVGSRSVDAGWGREGDRMNWEIGIGIYRVPGVDRELEGTCSLQQGAQLSAQQGPSGVDWAGGCGRGFKRETIYVCVRADSLPWTGDTNNTL